MPDIYHDPRHPDECEPELCQVEAGAGYHVASPRAWQGVGYRVEAQRVRFQDTDGSCEPWRVRLCVEDTESLYGKTELCLYPEVAAEIGLILRLEATTAAGQWHR